jgi:hypothetical protein
VSLLSSVQLALRRGDLPVNVRLLSKNS